MRVFVAVAEAQGFAAAARRLALSPPAVTRAIAALEARIGSQLLRRTTRQVRLTEARARFLADARRILGEIAEAESFAGGLHTEARGELGVTASVNFGRLFVAPIVLEFLEQFPRVSVRTLFLDRVVDLVDEGLDVAVRIAQLPDSDLAATRVGSVRRLVCASPEYLSRHGTPKTPKDLARHATIAFTLGSAEPAWSFQVRRRPLLITPSARLVVNTADVAIAAALHGRGLTRVLSYQVQAELRAGKLRAVLTNFEPAAIPVHVVHAGGRRASAKVRAFVELAVQRLKKAEFG